MLKVYFNVVGIILTVIVLFGGVLPLLISAASTGFVALGIGLGVLAMPLLAFWSVKTLGMFDKLTEKETKNEKV